MTKKTKTRKLIVVKDDDTIDTRPHSRWLLTGYSNDSWESARMELASLLTQDVGDRLDNDAIENDLIDSGFAIKEFDEDTMSSDGFEVETIEV